MDGLEQVLIKRWHRWLDSLSQWKYAVENPSVTKVEPYYSVSPRNGKLTIRAERLYDNIPRMLVDIRETWSDESPEVQSCVVTLHTTSHYLEECRWHGHVGAHHMDRLRYDVELAKPTGFRIHQHPFGIDGKIAYTKLVEPEVFLCELEGCLEKILFNKWNKLP